MVPRSKNKMNVQNVSSFIWLIQGVYKDECFYINPNMSVYLLSRNLVKHSEAREQEIKNQENLSEQADE